MNQRTAMIMATALTVFMLVLVAGLAMRFTQASDLAANAPTTSAATDVATNVSTLDPQIEALIREREATYQAALAEANQRLAAANAQIAAANRQVAQVSTASAKPAISTYPFSPEQARMIAQAAAPSATLRSAAELVRYEGKPAYEIRFDSGLVYIDAQTGIVLSNGALAASTAVNRDQAIQVAQAYLGSSAVVGAELNQQRGIIAYEVTFADGSIVYVDASTGQVAYATIQGGTAGNAEYDDDNQEGDHDD